MDVATKTCFVISHKTAKNSEAFSEGEFIRECLVDAAALICPKKKEAFENVLKCNLYIINLMLISKERLCTIVLEDFS